MTNEMYTISAQLSIPIYKIKIKKIFILLNSLKYKETGSTCLQFGPYYNCSEISYYIYRITHQK